MSRSRLLAPVRTVRAASALSTVTTNLGCPDGPRGVTVMPVTVIGVPYHLDEYLPELGVLALDAAVGERDVDHLQQPRLARSRALRLSVTMAASGEGPVPATSPCGNPASSLVVRRVTYA